MNGTPCLTYLRVSGVSQINGDGPERQRESIAKFAGSAEYHIKQEFFDGVSGAKDTFDRPALTDLFTAIRANGVRLVLVERADRIARDLMVGEIILAEFRKLGVKVLECEGGTDLTVEDKEPTKVLIRQILGAISQFEKCIIVQKLAAARRRIRDRGERCDGQPPYGSRPGEEETLKVILSLYREGKNLSTIAVWLNNEGLKPRKKRSQWYPQTVKRAIERYNAGRPKKKLSPAPSGLNEAPADQPVCPD
jgi:DNA invertase Pin-like site-specific DNA recombinase